jgi:hypothetical protein
MPVALNTSYFQLYTFTKRQGFLCCVAACPYHLRR